MENTQIPIITIENTNEKTKTYRISVVGKFGGGFSNVLKTEDELIGFLPYLKSYDCGSKPCFLVFPKNLTNILRPFFPQLCEKLSFWFS